ncbi:hypothetical protein NEOKW01_1569 [Nematocida sp. AWRm80]|nr:hypothetical protein NEOKW01_1569 [Nematocida sp. AWRm80]
MGIHSRILSRIGNVIYRITESITMKMIPKEWINNQISNEENIHKYLSRMDGVGFRMRHREYRQVYKSLSKSFDRRGKKKLSVNDLEKISIRLESVIVEEGLGEFLKAMGVLKDLVKNTPVAPERIEWLEEYIQVNPPKEISSQKSSIVSAENKIENINSLNTQPQEETSSRITSTSENTSDISSKLSYHPEKETKNASAEWIQEKEKSYKVLGVTPGIIPSSMQQRIERQGISAMNSLERDAIYEESKDPLKALSREYALKNNPYLIRPYTTYAEDQEYLRRVESEKEILETGTQPEYSKQSIFSQAHSSQTTQKPTLHTSSQDHQAPEYQTETQNQSTIETNPKNIFARVPEKESLHGSSLFNRPGILQRENESKETIPLAQTTKIFTDQTETKDKPKNNALPEKQPETGSGLIPQTEQKSFNFTGLPLGINTQASTRTEPSKPLETPLTSNLAAFTDLSGINTSNTSSNLGNLGKVCSSSNQDTLNTLNASDNLTESTKTVLTHKPLHSADSPLDTLEKIYQVQNQNESSKDKSTKDKEGIHNLVPGHRHAEALDENRKRTKPIEDTSSKDKDSSKKETSQTAKPEASYYFAPLDYSKYAIKPLASTSTPPPTTKEEISKETTVKSEVKRESPEKKEENPLLVSQPATQNPFSSLGLGLGNTLTPPRQTTETNSLLTNQPLAQSSTPNTQQIQSPSGTLSLLGSFGSLGSGSPLSGGIPSILGSSPSTLGGSISNPSTSASTLFSNGFGSSDLTSPVPDQTTSLFSNTAMQPQSQQSVETRNTTPNAFSPSYQSPTGSTPLSSTPSPETAHFSSTETVRKRPFGFKK